MAQRMRAGVDSILFLAAMHFPLAISGAEVVFHALFRLRRARLQVRVGQPLTLPPPEREGRSAAMQRNTDEIMCRIATLLPEGYRGVYMEYARVKELRNRVLLA